MGAAREGHGRRRDKKERLRSVFFRLLCLRLHPQRFHLVERCLGKRPAAASKLRLDMSKAPDDLGIGPAKRLLGLHREMAREIDDGEEDVAEFVLQPILVMGRLGKLLLRSPRSPRGSLRSRPSDRSSRTRPFRQRFWSLSARVSAGRAIGTSSRMLFAGPG